MTIDELKQDAKRMTHWQQHKFFVLISGVVIVSLFLVSVALSLYNNSGAAQLDLSRPGYQDIRDQAKRDKTAQDFPATGPLDKEALDTFASIYESRVKKITSVDSFGTEALSNESLRLFAEDPSADAPVPVE